MFVSSEFPPGPGGIGTHAHQLAINLQLLGWHVTVVSPQDYADEQEVTAFNLECPLGIERLRPKSPALLEALYRWRVVSRCIRRLAPDCLVASGSRSVWMAAPLADRYHLPWLAIAHGTELFLAGWQTRLTRWAFEKASTVVCVSQYTHKQMELARIHPLRSDVIPNGADENRFRLFQPEQTAAYRSQLGFGNSPLIVTVGNVTDRKGQDIVIRALPTILQHVPNVRYLIAGLPTRRAEFELLATQLGVSDHVHFLGRVDAEKLPHLLNTCDLFVMTSRHTPDGDFEGFGIAVVEAALCGLPAVVSAPSGLAEAIIDGHTGIAVPRDDPEATAQAVLSLLADPILRQKMGTQARQHAVSAQTWACRVQRYDELLRKLT